MLVDIVVSGLRQGLLLLPLAIGVHVAFRLVRFPDLTPDGSMVVGSAISALALLAGGNPLCAIIAGGLAGGLLGIMTAFISEFLKVDRILAGIATSLLAYSLVLRMLGRGNIALPTGLSTIYTGRLTDVQSSAIAAALVIVLVCIVATSRWGLRLRAVGENKTLSEALGARTRLRIVLGLFWSNACVGLSGSLILEHQRFVDVGQGAGSLFVGLACVLVGTAMPGHARLVPGILWSATGAIIYASLIAVALRVGLRPGDLRAITALFVLGITLLARRIAPGDRVPLFS